MQRNSKFWLIIWTVLVVGVGCRPTPAKKADVRFDLSLDPSPPVVGDVDVSLQLTQASENQASETPLGGADVQLEGNMNHAGMKPSFATLREVEPGKYTGTLKFTMGGDWFVLVTAKLSDGQTVESKIDVLGVQSP